ncbi:MAG: two-component regulator propeller domain-containing protein [Chitinophagaceae bacterium]
MKFILECLVLCFILNACKENIEQVKEDNNPLYPQPVTVTLDTLGGYVFNLFTGDSIRPLMNSTGDTIKTGVTVPLFSHLISKEVVKARIIEGVQTVKTIIPDNIHPIPPRLPVTTVDTARLTKVKLGEGDRSFVLRNTSGIVPTGVAIAVTGKKIPFSEPAPVKAAPMRFKDNATSSIQYLDVDQGLAYPFITAVYEDKKGILWFGVDGVGISKYDGINITTYSVKEGLTDNIVTTIFEDRNNKLWIGTVGGLTCFDGKNFTQFTEKNGLPSNMINSILEDRKGDLWFSTKAGLTRYDGKFFTNYTPKQGLPSDTIYKCIEDRRGNLWIGTKRGVAKFDGESFTHYTPADGLQDYLITDILEDHNGNIWFGSVGQGLARFDGKKFTRYTTKEGLSDNIIWSLVEDHNRDIWISTSDGGLNKFDGTNFTWYTTEQGLSKNKVRRMTVDKTGNILLATEGGGLNRIKTTSFLYQLPEEVVENNRIRPILKDKKGNLWFGTESASLGKLSFQNRNGKVFTYYKLQDWNFFKGQRSLLEDKKGNIWIGTTGSGIIRYDEKKFTNYTLGGEITRQSTFDILEDKRGNIWFGQRDGSIASYDGENFHLYSTNKALPGKIIYSMLEDKKGNIWFCTEGAGVYKYNGSTLINYTEKEGLYSKSITSVAEDDQGNLWMGTLGAGVCKFDGKDFTYYTEKQGLPDGNVWSVYSDPAGQLWVGTNKGLALLILQKDSTPGLKSSYAIFPFGSQDGLKAIDFNLHSVCVDNDNFIWWGTGKSAPSFDLNKGFQADSLRSLSLNYIDINDRFYDFRNLSDSIAKKITCSNIVPYANYPEKLSLSHKLNHLSFHFSAIDWAAPTKIKYSYRMVGLEEKWSRPSEEPVADYRNLSHGNYQFQVKAIGQAQLWTDPFIYSFTIRPAWWQTWWFKVVVLVALLTGGFFIARFIYFYQLRKQRVILEKQLAVQYERQRISAEMHDDIGAGLSGIRLLTELTKTKVKDEQGAEEVDKIYQSVGDISSKMKEVIWSLNTENDHLPNLVDYIQKQARAWLENYPCELHVELPGSIPPVEIGGETRRNILLVIKEAIHNIIKHSGAGKVSIKMNCENRRFSVTISDDGKGIAADHGHDTGNGMKNMRTRIRKLNGKFFIKTREGVTLTFEIPLQPPV